MKGPIGEHELALGSTPTRVGGQGTNAKSAATAWIGGD